MFLLLLASDGSRTLHTHLLMLSMNTFCMYVCMYVYICMSLSTYTRAQVEPK